MSWRFLGYRVENLSFYISISQDSYVSKGGPLGGPGVSETVKPRMDQILGARSFTPSVISAIRSSVRSAAFLQILKGVKRYPRGLSRGDRTEIPPENQNTGKQNPSTLRQMPWSPENVPLTSFVYPILLNGTAYQNRT